MKRYIYFIAGILIFAALGQGVFAATTTFPVLRQDKIPPIVMITSPFSGQTLSGPVNLKAVAWDNVGVVSLQFLVDGNNFGAALSKSPYSVPLDTTLFGNGSHTISARASDAAGNSGVSRTIKINISNKAPISVACTSFTYSDWSACQTNNTQTRTILTSSPAGCAGGAPVLSQSCVYVPPVTPVCSSFTYSNWGSCQTNNTQTRTVLTSSPSGCSGGSPVLSQSCVYTPPVCSAFTYSNWSACQTNNTQTRTVLTSSPSGCAGGSPVLSQSCVYVAPVCTSFTYSAWGSCQSNDTQSRAVVSQLPSGCAGGSPVVSQACIYTPPVQNPNLILNPSLETADASGTMPQSWFEGSWGTNQAVFTYPVAGFDGQKAAKIDVSNYTDGDAKWYFADVAAKAGQAYAFSDSFESTAPSSLTVRFLLSDNTYQYLALANLPASATWQTQTQKFSAPFNVVSMTVFHLIAGNGSLTVDNYYLGETTLDGGFSQGFVSLNFDDGWNVTYQNALPILDAVGLKSTQYIISGSFDDPEYVNQTQTLTMQAEGHEIGDHTKTHPDLTTLTAAQIQDEVAGSRSDMLAMGASPVDTFAYPYGNYNSQVESIVKSAGYTSARTVDSGFNIKTSDPYLLKTQNVEVGTTFAQIKSWIDAAVANKEWAILVFHQIDHSGDQYSSTPEMLQQIVDYLVQNNISVKTNSQGVALLGQ